MITAFSTNDVNDINQVLSDESFDRNELYDVWNALEDYRDKILNQDNEDSIIRAVKIQKTIDKIKCLIEIDLKMNKEGEE